MKSRITRTLLAAVFTLSFILPGFAAALGSPDHRQGTVSGNGSKKYYVTFSRGHKVHLNLAGSGKSQLRMIVRDHHGTEVATDPEDHHAYENDCNCEFVADGERYTLEVVNGDHHSTSFDLSWSEAHDQ
jgi:hypothetical protein